MTDQQAEWTITAALEHCKTLVEASDRMNKERFDAFERSTERGFATQKEAVTSALNAAERAVLKAEAASEKRFESVNEFRATLGDQQRTLMPRAEAEVMIKTVNDKLDAFQKQLDGITAERAGIKGGWGYAVGVVGFILMLLSLAAMFFRFGPK